MGNGFFDFLEEVGFDKQQTHIEKYRLDGTSNYLISLNHCGVTWAVAIRLPAMGSAYAKFEDEKLRAVNTAEFLVEHFGNGVSLSEDVRFVFAGDSRLISHEDVMEFFAFQNSLDALTQRESVTSEKREKVVESLSYPGGIDSANHLDANKKEQVKQYLSSYQGSFFVSKGAPASETLDDYWHMIPDVTHALCVLHEQTGRESLLPLDDVLSLAKTADQQLTDLASSTDFSEGSSVHESFQKHQRKRNPDNDERIMVSLKKELLLRTAPGKELLVELISAFEQDLADMQQYSCFTHNDPHCENFILVKYLYEVAHKQHPYIDREFANLLFQDAQQTISVVFDADTNSLVYRPFQDGDEQQSQVNVLRACTHYDIHLIDIDDASGIIADEQTLYLSDLLLFALSVQNISETKGEFIPVEDTIHSYYSY